MKVQRGTWAAVRRTLLDIARPRRKVLVSFPSCSLDSLLSVQRRPHRPSTTLAAAAAAAGGEEHAADVASDADACARRPGSQTD